MKPRSTGHAVRLPGFVLGCLVTMTAAQAAERPVLDARLRNAVARADSIATQRLLDEVTREREEPTLQRLGDPIGELRLCEIAWRDTLLAALDRADFTTPTRTQGQACTCYAEIRIQLWSDSTMATLRLCSLCGEVGVILGRSKADRFAQAGYFGGGAASFVRFVRTHHGDDEVLMEIVNRAFPARNDGCAGSQIFR